MEWNGWIEWIMVWIGLNGIESNGIEWNGIEWDGIE